MKKQAHFMGTGLKSFNNLTSTVLFFIILFCFLGVSGYLSIKLLREENQIKTHQHLMDLLAEQIDNIVTQHYKVVQALSKEQAVLDLLVGREVTPDTDLVHILETTRKISDAERIYAINRDGIIISSTHAPGKSILGDNYAFRPYFKDAWKGRTTVFPVLGGKSNTMELHFSTPIYGVSKDSIDGVLTLEFDIMVVEDLLYQRVEKIGLASPEGVIFTSNTPDWLFRSIEPMPADTLERIHAMQQFGGKKILPLQLDAAEKKIQMDNTDYYAVAVSMPISGWKLISLQKKDPQITLPLYYKTLVGTGLFVTGSLALLVFFLLVTLQKQKRTQSALFQTQKKYSSIFKNAVMGIYQSSIDGRFIDVNPAMAQILGFDDPETLISKIKKIDYQVYAHAEDRQKFLRKVLKHKQFKGFETEFLKSDGTVIWVQLSGRLARSPENNQTFLEGFCIDITEKIAAQKKAALRQQQLLDADRMISMGVLASGVAHEINNPNAFIHSNAQFLSDAWTEARIILDEYYDENGDFIISGLPYSGFKRKLPVISRRILEGTRRIARIIKELRNYSRSEKPELQDRIDVNSVIRSALVLLENMIKKHTRHFIPDLKDDIPSVAGSFQRLEQVIVNIIQNACQAMADDTAALYISSFYDASTKRVVVTCRDEGIGIPKENLKRIIDPFFTTKRDSGGTGLGLSISSTIVQEMGGRLIVTSESGKGTVVTLEFPPADSLIETEALK